MFQYFCTWKVCGGVISEFRCFDISELCDTIYSINVRYSVVWYVCIIHACFLYKINPNPRKIICSGEKVAQMPLLTNFFLGLSWPRVFWGVRRFHNNIYDFRIVVKSRTPSDYLVPGHLFLYLRFRNTYFFRCHTRTPLFYDITRLRPADGHRRRGARGGRPSSGNSATGRSRRREREGGGHARASSVPGMRGTGAGGGLG